MPKYNLFKKIVILIVVMLVPIMALYYYSIKTSTDVLEMELNKSNANQLIFFQNQVNTYIDLLSLWPNLLIQDPDISNLKDIFDYNEYLNLDTITLVKRIQTKLMIQENSADWGSRLFIYSPSLQRVVSVNNVQRYDDAALKNRLEPGWQVKKEGEEGRERFIFSLLTFTPFSYLNDPQDANLIIEIEFNSDNIEDMLDKFKSDGRTDPLYYKKGTGTIYNRTANKELANLLIQQLEGQELQDIENRTIDLDGEQYLLNIVKSDTIGWYLIDYMPLYDIIYPIEKSNRLFYISVGCLLLMSFLAAYLLYAGVQVPIRKLVLAFQKLKYGDYSIRMTPKGKNEFTYVFSQFNSMTVQIQELFEKVYLEKLHVREARLKQLQSQINPHFFYNCFSYISSMAKLEDYQAVVAMSQNLSKYYRYTTRQERDMVPLSEELDFVKTYLDIQKLRMKRLHYSMEFPVRMNKLDILLLMIQPLVENAVLHGIEPVVGAGQIRIQGEFNGGTARVIVEDDGKGMTLEEMYTLEQKFTQPMEEDMGCGLWNVNRRLQLCFGESAGLSFSKSLLGGLKVTLSWSYNSLNPIENGGDKND